MRRIFLSYLIAMPMAIIGLSSIETNAQEIEEVVVSATKRDESLQDVNIAVNAFTGQDLDQLGWEDITNIANQAPNVDVKYAWGNSMPIYTIRGVGMNSFQASDTASVGLFIDEVFQTSIVSMGAQLYDMERVEVLKGPQSALFGRNTNGGAVNYFSRKPSMESEGYINLDTGKYEKRKLEGAYGGQISENMAARVSFVSNQQNEGWVYNRTTGNKQGEVDISAVRLQLLWEKDDTSVLLKVASSEDRSQPVYFQHIGTNKIGGGYCDAYLQGRLDPNTCFDVLGYSDTDNDWYAGDYTNVAGTPINEDSTLENDHKLMTLTITKSFENFEFKSITSTTEYDRVQPKESDGNPALFLDFLFNTQMESWSQEFRLVSTTDSNFSWIAGVQFSEDDVAESPPRIGFTSDWIGFNFWLQYTQERENNAIYAQGKWQLSDKTSFELGGRYLNDKMNMVSQVGIAFGYPAAAPAATLASCPNAFVDPCGLDENAFTWKAALNHTPDEDTLWYVSLATGYKPGGINGGLNTNPRLYKPFKEEEVESIEIGYKATILDGRATLNAALFNYSYEGLQAATARETGDGLVLNFLTNLETADVSGFEAEFKYQATDNLQWQLGVGKLNTKNNDPGENFDGPLGNSARKLPNAPELNYNIAIDYEKPLEVGGTMNVFVDYVYEGDHYKEVVNIPMLKITNKLLNARITWNLPDDKTSISFWGKNLNDDVYIMDTLGASGATGWGVFVTGMPRTYGLSLDYRF